jgi:excinuclease UvrABC ATPase subunit
MRWGCIYRQVPSSNIRACVWKCSAPAAGLVGLFWHRRACVRRVSIHIDHPRPDPFVLTEVRKKGCRLLIVDGKPVDISAQVELDQSKIKDMDAVVDRLVISRKHEKAIKAAIAATLLVGDGLMQIQIVKGASKAEAGGFYRGLGSKTHHFVYANIQPEYFMFNNPESACRTCGGSMLFTSKEAQTMRTSIRARLATAAAADPTSATSAVADRKN